MKSWQIILIIVVIIVCVFIYYQYKINIRPNKQQLLVLRNYNTDGGLHWMGIYNPIVAANEAKKNNLKLVILLDSGLYLEKEGKHIEEYKDFVDTNNNEWFSYYFEPIGINEPEINKLWKEGKLNKLPSYKWFNSRKNVIGYEFDRNALEKADKKFDYAKVLNEIIKLKPYLQKKVEDFYNKYMKGYFLVGIHARGTDKFSSVDSHENHPKHFTYKQYADAIEKEVLIQKELQNKPVAIFACSDEQPFIDYMKENLGNKYKLIVADNILRSDISTSGVNLLCDDDNEECTKYKNKSIHRGMKDKSNYKKGLDSVYETYLLSKCDVFYRSRGNFSDTPPRINPNMKVIDMVTMLN